MNDSKVTLFNTYTIPRHQLYPHLRKYHCNSTWKTLLRGFVLFSLEITVTPQNVILTQNVITIAAKCNTNTKCNKIINAKCNNFPTQNVITQIVITHELQVCSTKSKISNSIVNLCFDDFFLSERKYFFCTYTLLL